MNDRPWIFEFLTQPNSSSVTVWSLLYTFRSIVTINVNQEKWWLNMSLTLQHVCNWCSTNFKKATPTLQQHDQELDITQSPYIHHACLWPNGLAFIYHIQQPGPDDTDFKNNDSLFTKQTLMTIWGTLSLAHLRPYYNTSHHKSYLWNPTVWD